MDNKNTNKLLILVFTIFSIILLFVAGSYAFFSYKGEGNNTVSLTTNDITFKYKEGTNSISLNGAMPMTDDHGISSINYFDFEVDASVPNGIQIPYYITARKTADSDNIDDAIKIGLTIPTVNEHNIYGDKFNEKNIIVKNWEEYLNYDKGNITGEVIHRTGDIVAGDKYTLDITLNGPGYTYSTLDECQNSDAYKNTAYYNYGVRCERSNSSIFEYYRIVYHSQFFDSLEECQAAPHFFGDSCTLIYHDGDTYDADVAHVKTWREKEFDSMEACVSDADGTTAYSSDECALKYAPGEKEIESIIGIYNYNDLTQYENQSIDLSNFTEKMIYSVKVSNVSNYNRKYRLRMWLDYDTDFMQEKYNNATFGLNINVYSEGKIKTATLAPGLYDSNNNLLASWDTLVNTYRLDVEYDYNYGDDYNWDEETKTYSATNSTLLDYILQNNAELTGATKLVVGNVSRIGELSFLNTTLKEVVLSDTVTEIGYEAFLGSTNLTNVVLSGSLISIDNYAFEKNTALTSITLPTSLTSINYGAFYNCTSLTTVTLETPSFLNYICDESVFYNTPWYINESQNYTVDVYLNGILIEEGK